MTNLTVRWRPAGAGAPAGVRGIIEQNSDLPGTDGRQVHQVVDSVELQVGRLTTNLVITATAASIPAYFEADLTAKASAQLEQAVRAEQLST